MLETDKLKPGFRLLCSVFDQKADFWTDPRTYMARAQAIRVFGDAINDPQSIFGKHPEDYSLFVVGAFDEQDGVVIGYDVPEHLINGISLKQQEE